MDNDLGPARVVDRPGFGPTRNPRGIQKQTGMILFAIVPVFIHFNEASGS
jgi:hypothetical protein